MSTEKKPSPTRWFREMAREAGVTARGADNCYRFWKWTFRARPSICELTTRLSTSVEA